MDSSIDFAKSLFEEKKFKETIDTCNKILTKNRYSISALKLIAKCLLATNKIEDSRLYLEKALEINPDDHEIFKELGNSYQLSSLIHYFD